MDLTEFLLARITEDEVEAQAGDQHFPGFLGRLSEYDGLLSEEVAHIARFDPARVLAECAAKRLIIERASHQAPGTEYEESYREVLECLAVVYDEHPDYLPEWRR